MIAVGDKIKNLYELNTLPLTPIGTILEVTELDQFNSDLFYVKVDSGQKWGYFTKTLGISFELVPKPSMISLDNEFTIMIDIDDTLIMWDSPNHPHEMMTAEDQIKYNKEDLVHILDPYTKDNWYFRKHNKHIEFLKTCKAQGYQVIVWSGGGAKWAKTVTEALGLQEFVDVTMVKPIKFVDDLPANEVLVNRIYLKD